MIAVQTYLVMRSEHLIWIQIFNMYVCFIDLHTYLKVTAALRSKALNLSGIVLKIERFSKMLLQSTVCSIIQIDFC